MVSLISLMSIIGFVLVLKFKKPDTIIYQMTTLGVWIHNLILFALIFINIVLLYLYNIISLKLKLLLVFLVVLVSIVVVKLLINFSRNTIKVKGNEVLIK
jgi:hypothetical protein